MTPAFILQALGVEVSPEWINYLEEPTTMKTETELALGKELDTLLWGMMQDAPALERNTTILQAKSLVTQMQQAAYNQGVASQQALVDATVAEGNGMQTSIIRATVAAVMEVASGYTEIPEMPKPPFSLTMSLEAQRTIWDRVELTTARDESQENVTFTIHKK